MNRSALAQDALHRAAGIVALAAARRADEGEAVIERLVGNGVFHPAALSSHA
jgi:hypothetical protein